MDGENEIHEWYECTECCYGTNRINKLIEHVAKSHRKTQPTTTKEDECTHQSPKT